MKTEETYPFQTTFPDYNFESSPQNDFSIQSRFSELYPEHSRVCIQGNKGVRYCTSQCKSHAILCNNEDCPCQSHHKKCSSQTKISLFNECFKNKLAQTNLFTKIQETMIEIQNYISTIEDEMISQLKKLGLSSVDKDFSRWLQQDYDKIITNLSISTKQEKKSSSQSQPSSSSLSQMNFIGSSIRTYLEQNKQQDRKGWIKQTEYFNRTIKETSNKINILLGSLKKNIVIQCAQRIDKDEMFEDSKIIKSLTEKRKMKLLTSQLDIIKAQRVFQGSVDSLASEKFHEKCDDRVNLLYIVENQYGFKYGGYSPCPISIKRIGTHEIDESLSSFIFSLDVNERAKVIKKQYAIQNGSKNTFYSTLVSFGESKACSFVIGTNSNKVKALNWVSFHKKGKNSCYQMIQKAPSKMEERGTKEDQCLLREVEVYQLTLFN